ncbi:MAG TPA: site-2 protease family protein [Gemmataceae bacterium]|nr:site-2 protease family protein [Gemmataceae bacterium]
MDNKENLRHADLNQSFQDKPPIAPRADANESLQEKAPATPPPPEPTIGQWLRSNIVTLAILGAILVYVILNFSPSGQWAIAKAALGLSFVIFIHELGHFLVAKWCDVHVTTFSIGFGPPIPGCSFQWGETNYRLALFPLGGYVQMVGQVDGDESSDGNEDDPRSYRNKTVWQRMAIISAGVVMNVILAIICFVIVFQGPGKDRSAAVVAAVDSDSPAFVKGVRWEGEIVQIGKVKYPYFDTLMPTVMGTRRGESLDLSYRRPGDKEPTELQITPMASKGRERRPVIGVSPSQRLVLASRRELPDPSYKHPVWPHTVAAEVQDKIQFGDRIIATTDPDNPKEIKVLPNDPRKPDQPDYFEYLRRMQVLADQPVTLRLERDVDGKTTTQDVTVPPAFHYTFGARMQMGEIVALREDSPATKAQVQARNKDKNLEGDVIRMVEVKDPDGKPIKWGTLDPKGIPLDPVRLPDKLKQWARQMSKAKAKDGPYWKEAVTLYVNRHRAEGGIQYEAKTIKLDWNNDWQYDKVLPFSSASPQPIPELGLAYQVKTTVAYVPRDKAKTTELRENDEIKQVRFFQLTEEGDLKPGRWVELGPDEFAWVFFSFQFPGSAKSKKIEFQVKREGELKEIEFEPQQDLNWPLTDDRGLMFSRDLRRQKADNFFEAVGMGFKDTYDNMAQVYQNLRGMIEGDISIKNLGGPITIARVAYRIAGYDFWEFLFFIGMISVNLAVINFLPIPVLDGGHMVFLIYEKIRGKPASEGVRVATTYAGLALILSLMVFVLYQDIWRIFRG